MNISAQFLTAVAKPLSGAKLDGASDQGSTNSDQGFDFSNLMEDADQAQAKHDLPLLGFGGNVDLEGIDFSDLEMDAALDDQHAFGELTDSALKGSLGIEDASQLAIGDGSPADEIDLAEDGQDLFAGYSGSGVISANIAEEAATMSPVTVSASSVLGTSAAETLSGSSRELNGAPTFFRHSAGNDAVGSVTKGLDVLSTLNELPGRTSSVLELFNLRAAVDGARVSAAEAAKTALGPSNQQNALYMFGNASQSVTNALNALSGSHPSVALGQFNLSNPSSQIPTISLSTVPGISNHILMQVHPAITERATSVENSLITPVPQRAEKSIELQLVPRSLGVVDMKIVNQNGVLRIAVQTETAEAQRLIRAEVASMTETFRAAGLKLEEFTVTQNSRLDSNMSGERDGRNDASSFRFHEGADDTGSRDRSFDENDNGTLFDDNRSAVGQNKPDEDNSSLPERNGLYL